MLTNPAEHRGSPLDVGLALYAKEMLYGPWLGVLRPAHAMNRIKMIVKKTLF
jgi:hypothetical protein